jgi:Tfp pilus assembly protein PilW
MSSRPENFLKQSAARRNIRLRAGLTFVELMIGLVITSMVAAAVGAVMVSTGQGWTASQTSQQNSALTSQSILRIQKILRSAKQIGTTRTGSISSNPAQTAAVMLWKGDVNSDGKIQFSELAMIEHHYDSADADNCTILYWDVSFPSAWTTAAKQAADSTMADNCIYDANVIETFKTMANVHSTVSATNVINAQFKRIDSSSKVRPLFEYAFKFQRDGVTTIKYGTTTLRTPTTMPAGQT